MKEKVNICETILTLMYIEWDNSTWMSYQNYSTGTLWECVSHINTFNDWMPVDFHLEATYQLNCNTEN